MGILETLRFHYDIFINPKKFMEGAFAKGHPPAFEPLSPGSTDNSQIKKKPTPCFGVVSYYFYLRSAARTRENVTPLTTGHSP